MTPADLATWLFTYAVHGTVLLTAVWLLTRHPRLGRPAPADALWKAALVGGLITATVHQAYGPMPWHAGETPAEAGGMEGRRLDASTAWTTRRLDASTAAAPGAAAGVVEPPSRRAAEPAAAEPPSPQPPSRRAAEASAAADTIAPRVNGLLAAAAPWAVALWAIFAAAALVRLGLAHLRLARWLAPRRPVTDPELIEVAHDLAIEAGLPAVRLTWSPELYSPVALGRGEVCLPSAAFDELDSGQLRSVLAHEIAHLARRDPWWLAGAVLLERVFFFQPLNRLARRRMQDAAEFLCDEWAAREAGSGITLATSLARVAEWLDPAPARPLPLAGMAESRSQLVRRVQRLMDGDVAAPARHARRWRIAAAALVLGTGLAVPGIGIAERAAAQDDAGTESSTTFETDLGRWESEPAPVPHADPDALAIASDVELQESGGAEADAEPDPNPDADADPGAGPNAALLAGKYGDRKAIADTTRERIIQALIEGLRDRDAQVRLASAEALGDLEDRRAVPGLTQALGDDVPEVRRAAVHALGHLEDASTVEPLMRAVGDSDLEVRQEAAHALGHLEDRRAVPALIPLLRDRSSDVRQAAAEALGGIGDRSAADALAAALGDESADVRQSAAEALGNLELTTAPPQLLSALRDPAPDVQRAAAEAVGEIGDARAVPALREMLDSGTPESQEHAAEALGEIRTPEALEALVAAMRSPNPNVRRHAASALGRD